MKKTFKRMDKPLFFSTVVLCVIGLIMIFSSSSVSAVLRYSTSTYHFFAKQLVFLLFGFAVGIFFILRHPIKKYKKFSIVYFLGVMISLIALFSYGSIINSANSWFALGPITIQPSEFAKSAIILYVAFFFDANIASKERFFYLRPLIACFVIVGLIFIQPDLGTAAIVGLLIYMVFMSLPLSKKDKDIKMFKIAGTSLIGLVVLVMIFGGGFLNSEQASRLTYKNPCSRYIEKTGYQVCNGMIAMNNGGLFGVGLGRSSQKRMYLPDDHTDFIFPIIVEELGAVVGVAIILLYVFIMFRLLRISKNATTLAGSVISFGTASVIMLHLLINFGGILALIPMTGVPVPLLSYGGSVTLNILFLIFLSLRVSVETSKSKEI